MFNRVGVIWLIAAAALSVVQAQEELPLQKHQDYSLIENSQPTGKRLWQVSIAALTVANVLDVHSSLGKRELNSALADSSGTLGTRGVLLKSGLQGGLLGIEYLILRGHSHSAPSASHSRLYRTLAIINFASSAALAGVAAHNYMVPRTQP